MVTKYTLKRHMKSDGDAVALIPFHDFATTSRISPQAGLFDQMKGSTLLMPGSFHSFLRDDHFDTIVRSIGTLEANHINDSYVAVLPLKEISSKTAPAMERLNEMNALIKNFSANLWLYRDNSVNTDAGYLLVKSKAGIIIHKNDMQLHYFDAHGLDGATTKFTFKEVKNAAAWAYESAATNMESAKAAHDAPTSRVKGGNRMDRFWVWVIDARRQSDVLIKVATYITALEALLATSNAELSHQLSERVAILMPRSEGIDAIAAYRKLKKAYGFRSKALHGATIQPKEQEALLATSNFLDCLCRNIMVALQEQPNFREKFADNESIDTFFVQQLLGREDGVSPPMYV